MNTSSYQYVKTPQILLLERFALAFRFDGSKSDIALYASKDASDRKSYILNGIFFPLLLIFIWIVWMLAICFRCRCGGVSLFSAELGCCSKESDDTDAADKVDGADDSDKKDEEQMEEKEKVNASIATIAENETMVVRGKKIDQRRYDRITFHMKWVRIMFIIFAIIVMTVSLTTMVIMIFIHSAHSTIQNETDILLLDIDIIHHALVEITEASNILYESQKVILTKIGTYGVQSCLRTDLLKSTAEDVWISLTHLGGIDTHSGEMTDLLNVMDDAKGERLGIVTSNELHAIIKSFINSQSIDV